MLLTRHQTGQGVRWALDGYLLPQSFRLSAILAQDNQKALRLMEDMKTDQRADSPTLAPIEPDQEVWASGVTYLRSREARREESHSADVYERVYEAERPELFFKAVGWRVVGNGGLIRVRKDSGWNVPEPEMTLVINSRRQITGYCVGNDVSSRSIEGENPLYLPQAKIYNGSCALGPGILLTGPERLRDLPIELLILRSAATRFQGQTRTSRMNRSCEELVDFLFRELDFPEGVFLMTGTGIVPNEDFTLAAGDSVRITIGDMSLENQVASAN